MTSLVENKSNNWNAQVEWPTDSNRSNTEFKEKGKTKRALEKEKIKQKNE